MCIIIGYNIVTVVEYATVDIFTLYDEFIQTYTPHTHELFNYTRIVYPPTPLEYPPISHPAGASQ